MKKKNHNARPVNRETLAAFLNLTNRRVHQLVAEGLPREFRGKYDLNKCAQWYIRYLQAAIEKRAIPLEGKELISEQKARVRKLRADADLKELELDRQRSGLVAVGDVSKEMTRLANTVQAQILGIAPRLAPDLLGETSRVMAQAKIEKALRESLALLATRGAP